MSKFSRKSAALIVLISVLVLGIPGALFAGGQGEEEQTVDGKQTHNLKLAQLFAPDSDLGISARKFAKIVEEESEGRIKVQVFDTGQLGGQKEVFDMLKRGSLDFNIDWPMTSYNSKLALVFGPYMFTSWEGAQAAYSTSDGWLTGLLGDVFAEAGIHYLGPYPYEFSGVTLNARPATTFDAADGLKIRTPPIKPFASTWQALGFTPTPIDYSETPTAIQTGVVDGQAGGGPEQGWSDFRDVSTYYVHYKDYFSCAQFMMSQATRDKLYAEDRKIIQKAADTIIAERFQQAESREQHYLEKLKEDGVEVVFLSEEEMVEAKKHVREKVWPTTFKELVGDEFMDVIMKNAE